jgi:uncharacterized protein (UPF0332 family)
MSRKEIQELLEKARRSLAAAEVLAQQGYNDFATSRTYYAMFYAAQALLLTRDARRTKHSGIIAAFNELFVHTGELPQELFLWLRDAFEDRAEGDYGFAAISEEQASAGIDVGRKFVNDVSRKVEEWLRSQA